MIGLGGALTKLAQIREHKHYRKCERCQLRYDGRQEKCSHCGELDDAQLQEFLERRRAYREGRRWLGQVYLVIALLLAVAFLIWLL